MQAKIPYIIQKLEKIINIKDHRNKKDHENFQVPAQLNSRLLQSNVRLQMLGMQNDPQLRTFDHQARLSMHHPRHPRQNPEQKVPQLCQVRRKGTAKARRKTTTTEERPNDLPVRNQQKTLIQEDKKMIVIVIYFSVDLIYRAFILLIAAAFVMLDVFIQLWLV